MGFDFHLIHYKQSACLLFNKIIICSGISTKWLLVHGFHIELQFRGVDFWGGRKTGASALTTALDSELLFARTLARILIKQFHYSLLMFITSHTSRSQTLSRLKSRAPHLIVVTYSADTAQQYTLVSHAHERCVINKMASVCYTVSEWTTKSNKSSR